MDVGDDGSWENRAYVTSSRGERMIFVAAVVGPETRAQFEEVLDYWRSKDLNQSHVKRLPPGTKVAQVTVQVEG